MSVVANYIGSLQKPEYNEASLTGTVATVYTVKGTNKGLTLAAFSFANVSGGAVVCELYHWDGSNDWLIWVGSVADDTTTVVTDNPVRLEASNQIRARAGSGGAVSGVTVKLSLISQLETQTR